MGCLYPYYMPGGGNEVRRVPGVVVNAEVRGTLATEGVSCPVRTNQGKTAEEAGTVVLIWPVIDPWYSAAEVGYRQEVRLRVELHLHLLVAYNDPLPVLSQIKIAG